jgi:hypothetical protein
MLRRRVREHSESRNGVEQIFGGMLAAKVANGGADRGLVALEERLEKIYFLPFFFAGAFAVDVGAGWLAVEVMPSPSERLSSMSTVCVIGSVPFGAGCAVAGAIVCVVGCVLVAAFFCLPQPNGSSATRAMTKSDLFTMNPGWNPMQFP